MPEENACLFASDSAHVKPLDYGAAGAFRWLVKAANLGGLTPEHLHPVLHLHVHAGPRWKTEKQ